MEWKKTVVAPPARKPKKAIKPWQGFAVVAVLGWMGHGFRFANAEDFWWFVYGALVWGGIFAFFIWWFHRDKQSGNVSPPPAEATPPAPTAEIPTTIHTKPLRDAPKTIVKCAIAAIVAMLLFPPFQARLANGVVRNLGYGFLFDPPQLGSLTASVDIGMLVVQWIAVGIVTALLVWLQKK